MAHKEHRDRDQGSMHCDVTRVGNNILGAQGPKVIDCIGTLTKVFCLNESSESEKLNCNRHAGWFI